MKRVRRVEGLVVVLIRARVANSSVHRPGSKPDYSSPVLRNKGYLLYSIDLIAFSVIFHRFERMPIGLISLTLDMTVLFILLRRAILH